MSQDKTRSCDLDKTGNTPLRNFANLTPIAFVMLLLYIRRKYGSSN